MTRIRTPRRALPLGRLSPLALAAAFMVYATPAHAGGSSMPWEAPL